MKTISALLLFALNLVILPVNAGTNVCNYWFVYLYNQYTTPINFELANAASGSMSSPTSGTINPGDNVKIYYGSNESGKEVYTGGLLEITDQDNNAIGKITISGSDSNMEAGCFFDTVMSIYSGYKACGNLSQNSAPGICTECVTGEAMASGMGDGSSSTGATAPAVGYTICQ